MFNLKDFSRKELEDLKRKVQMELNDREEGLPKEIMERLIALYKHASELADYTKDYEISVPAKVSVYFSWEDPIYPKYDIDIEDYCVNDIEAQKFVEISSELKKDLDRVNEAVLSFKKEAEAVCENWNLSMEDLIDLILLEIP